MNEPVTARPIGSQRIRSLAPSATIATAKRVRELQAEGRDILSLTLGEPDFNTPVHIKNAGVEAIRANATHYPPVAGLPELRQAAADYLRANFSLPYAADNIVVSTGAKQSLYNVFQCLLDPGDEVLLPAPYWVSYASQVELAGARVTALETTLANGLKLQPEQLAAALTPETRMFVFNSPVNPTGAVYAPNEVAALVEVLAQHPQLWIVTDDIYAELTFGVEHRSLGSFPEIFDRTITITGVAKAFAMTGWRVGIMAAPVEVAKLCEKLQGQVTSGTCSIAQHAALAAYQSNLVSVQRMRSEFLRRRDLLLELFAEQLPRFVVPPPEGAFYFFPDVSAYFGSTTPDGSVLQSGEDFALFLLDHAGVAVVPGEAFGAANHIRISFATSTKELRAAVARMAKALETLLTA